MASKVPALQSIARHALRYAPGALRAPLAQGLQRAYGSLLATRAGNRTTKAEDGLPVPPPNLRYLVAVDRALDPDEFLRSGKALAGYIRELLERNGRPIEEMQAILDFGCGCGRVTRWWADLQGPRIAGSDYQKPLVRWCRRNLSFMEAAVNGLEPPLPYEDEQFDFIYALSVFTHLSAELERAWLDELRRVLRPGGLLLFTTQGDAYRPHLEPEQRAAFDRGERVVREEGLPGSNICSVWHPRSYVRDRILADLELIEVVPGRDGVLMQDGHLVRKPAGRPTSTGRGPHSAR